MGNAEFQTWIERDGRMNVAVLLAARAAARAVPCLAGMQPRLPFSDERVSSVIASMQSILLAMSADLPFADDDKSNLMGILGAKIRVLHHHFEYTVAGRSAQQSTLSLVQSLACALREDDMTWHTATMALTFASQALTDDGAILASVVADIADLESGFSPSELVLRPLWNNKEPVCVSPNWVIIKQALLTGDEQHRPWVGWYESVRDGKPWGFNAGVSSEGSFFCDPTP